MSELEAKESREPKASAPRNSRVIVDEAHVGATAMMRRKGNAFQH
jgi:hypothetical protein